MPMKSISQKRASGNRHVYINQRTKYQQEVNLKKMCNTEIKETEQKKMKHSEDGGNTLTHS